MMKKIKIPIKSLLFMDSIDNAKAKFDTKKRTVKKFKSRYNLEFKK